MTHDRPRLTRIAEGSFASVIRAYQASPQYKSLAPSSQKLYAYVLRLAERETGLGGLSIYVIRPALVQAFLDGLAATPGTQKNAWAVLKAIETWAMPRDLLPYPITTGTAYIVTDTGHVPWTEAQIALAEQHARPDLARLITLAVNTGQRGSDLVRMRLGDIEERDDPVTGKPHPGFNVTQKKTGRRLWVPMTNPLVAALELWRKDIRPPWLIVTKPDGSAYTREQLSWTWNDQRDNRQELAPLKEAGLVIHGLRGACVVRLRKAGASVLQICSMIGMSEPMVTRYSRFADQCDMAMAAVHYLNAGTAREQEPANKIKSPG